MTSSIEVPPNAFNESNSSYVFNHYNQPVLFPLVFDPDDVNVTIVTDSEVIGFTIPGETVVNLTTPIQYRVQSLRGREGLVNLFS